MRSEDLEDLVWRESNIDRVDPTAKLLREVFTLALRDVLKSMALRAPDVPPARGAEAQALERKREKQRLLVEEIRNLDRNMARLADAVEAVKRSRHDPGPWWG